MNGKIGQIAVAGGVLLLWLLCIACSGDPSTTGNIAQTNSSSTTGLVVAEQQTSETSLTNASQTIPPAPVSRYQGKRNPFSPLVTMNIKQEPVVTSARPVKRDPQTTLEKIALGRLTLTAIFKGPRGIKALVEEEGGKGHIVEKGAFIGTRGGRVQAITTDRIIIVEKTTHSNNETATHKKELKLASRPNDP